MKLLASELEQFDRVLAAALYAQREHLSAVELRLYRGGKRLRPMLLMLAARAAQPAATRDLPLPEKAIRAAASLEMLHVATLVHDDIVDGAETRRGVPSVSGARGPQVALLVGDLQFVQAIRCFADAVDSERDMELVRLVLGVGYRLCCGQLDELAIDRSAETVELRRRYLRIADRKTAILFAVACECGAVLGGGGERDAYLLGRFGRGLGRAFQIMDDLRDLVEPQARSGKPRGADLAQGRLSLPLIYARDMLAPQSAALAALRGEPLSPDLVEAAAEEVVASPAFLRAYADARAEVARAAHSLSRLAPGEHRDALEAVAFDTVDRGFTSPPKRTRTEVRQ